MPEREDTPPRLYTTPLAQRGKDKAAGGADSSPHDTEPPSRPKPPPDKERQPDTGGRK